MKLVIDITDEMWQAVQDGWVGNELWHSALKNGTPLPKGHGRIGDLDQVLLWMIYKKCIIDELKCGEIAPVFKDATIIEAESGGGER